MTRIDTAIKQESASMNAPCTLVEVSMFEDGVMVFEYDVAPRSVYEGREMHERRWAVRGPNDERWASGIVSSSFTEA